MDKKEEMKPCPFCGGDARETQSYFPSEVYVGCQNDYCRVYPLVAVEAQCSLNEDGKTYTPDFDAAFEKAIEIWNTRIQK